MTVHLLKMCVGAGSVDQLRALQGGRLARQAAAGEVPALRHWTRNFPRRAGEIAGLGSLYWIIKGSVRVRQRILALERADDAAALKRCAIVLDADLVETAPRRCRPMQGWRYLEPADAPPDARPRGGDDAQLRMPAEMVEELRDLGLL